MCFQPSFNTHACNSRTTTAASLEIKACIVLYLTIGVVVTRHQACLLVTVEYYRRGKTWITKTCRSSKNGLCQLFDAADALEVSADMDGSKRKFNIHLFRSVVSTKNSPCLLCQNPQICTVMEATVGGKLNILANTLQEIRGNIL